MNIIPFESENNEPQIHRVSLDDAWFKAEKLGSVSLGKTWHSDKHYTAEIKFKTKNGSSVRANGEDQNPIFALEKCIHEAISLGATEK